MNRETTRARSGLVDRAMSALGAASATATRSLNRHAADFEISDAKLELLAVLCSHEGDRCCLHELGDELGVTRPNVTKLVDGLEEGGLVERVAHPRDGRMVQATLTERGAEVARQALPGRRERLEECWSALDDSEIETLILLLERIPPQPE